MTLVTTKRVTRIYSLSDSNGEIRYVGKTVRSLCSRLAAHVRCARQGATTHCANWIRSLSAPPMIRLLEETEHGNEREKAWIALMRTAGVRLTNLTDGGDGAGCGNKYNLGRKCSNEKRIKLSIALKGRTVPIETRAKMSASHIGYKQSNEHRANNSAARKGKPHSAERRARNSAGHLAYYKRKRAEARSV